MFKKAIEVILKHEGGYINHPNDPGGETKYGISKRAFPNEDIKNLTIERAKEIYLKKYWEPLNLCLIHDENLALHLFDHAVNAGTKTAVKMLQRIVKTSEDGIMGPITANAANKDKCSLDKYIRARYTHYYKIAEQNPKLNVFLKGWMKRVESTEL